jgi:penicillin-binding protein-related factor A (putative recombinase)
MIFKKDPIFLFVLIYFAKLDFILYLKINKLNNYLLQLQS